MKRTFIAKVVKPDCLYRGQLKDRGWTDSLILKILGAPDHISKRSGGGKIHWFVRDIVEASEVRPEFLVGKAAGEKRSATGKAAALKRAEQLIASARSWRSPALPARSLDNIRRAAVQHYNDRAKEREMERLDGFTNRASLSDSQAFLDRITVNYLRHEKTAYEQHLYQCQDKPGAEEARSIVRRQAYETIKLAYPDLRDECDRQLQEREG